MRRLRFRYRLPPRHHSVHQSKKPLMNEDPSGPPPAISFLIFFSMVAAVAVIGSFFSPGQWYASLVKPPLTPPNWIFGPVWTTLYLLIAIAGWQIWELKRWPDALRPLGIWWVQLILNCLWSWLFFGLHQPKLAFVAIIVLWVSILANVIVFGEIKPSAGLLLVPYLCWVGFAGWLNFMFWQLNP